jgi:hypothetical protein
LDDGTTVEEGDVSGGSTATSVTFTDLTAGTQYIIKIAAFNAYGTGVYSTSVTQYTAPAAPTNVLVADNSDTTKFDITWTESTTTGSTYVVLWHDGTNFNEETFAPDTTACASNTCTYTYSKSTFLTSTGISDGTTVSVKVRALHTNSGSVGTDSDQSPETDVIAKKPEITGATVAYESNDVKLSWTVDRDVENLAHTVYIVENSVETQTSCTSLECTSLACSCIVDMASIQAIYTTAGT